MNPLQKIKNLFKSKDAKVLLENFVSLSALQLVGMLLPLITLPYVLRVIDFDKFGIIALATSFTTYFQSITDYSFQITATRDVSIFKQSPKKLNFIYSKVMSIKFIFLTISFLIIFLVILLYPPFFEERLVFLLSSIMLIGYALFPTWFFQGIEKMKYITFLNVGIKLFFTIFIFFFINEKEDYWIYPLLNSAGFIGAGLVGQYIILKKFKLKFYWIKPRILKQTIKKNFPIFVNQFSPVLYNNSNIFVLGFFVSDYLLGIYSAIQKIIELAARLLNITSRVFFPFLNRKKEKFKDFKKMLLAITSLLVLSIILLNKVVFWYLNIEHTQAFTILSILLVGLFGIAIYNIWGLNYFIIKRNDKLVMKNTILASLIGFFLAFPLIYFYGIIGAAINLSLARLIMGGGLWIKYLKYK